MPCFEVVRQSATVVLLFGVLACADATPPGASSESTSTASTASPASGDADDGPAASSRLAVAPVPARMAAHLPPPPASPPALSPHTEFAPGPLEISSDEPTAGTWKPILFTLDMASVAAPPQGDAAAADAAETAAFRDDDPQLWRRTAHWWDAGSVRRWNEVARTLTVRRHLNSGLASRMFALLAVAQYDASVAARRAAAHFAVESADHGRLAQFGQGHVERFGYPSDAAAVASASYEVLSHLFPTDVRFLEQNVLAATQSGIWSGAHRASDVAAGLQIGQAAGRAAVAWAKADGSKRANGPGVKEQPDRWFAHAQTLPGWGNVRPWTLTSADQFRAPAPPDVHSPEFAAALHEIRELSDQRSAEELAIAQYWDLGVGGISVPGMYDQMALAETAARGLSEPRTARVLALLNMAMMDASIACWETKYHYLVPRPSMRDPDIRLPLGLPTHPSYTSGHSAFSGAAEGILSNLFPEHAEEFHRRAEEASASRWYGGIHYRFDGDEGLVQGRKVAAWVLAQRAATDGCPPSR